MTDRVELGDVERRNNYSYPDGAFQETYSDRISALLVKKSGSSEEPAALDFSTRDIYRMPGDNPSHWDPIYGYETTGPSSASSGADRAPTSTQSDELNEGFSSRMNREDDRQPYLDSQRHQDEMPAQPSNEQPKESGEVLRSRLIRIDDPQPDFE